MTDSPFLTPTRLLMCGLLAAGLLAGCSLETTDVATEVSPARTDPATSSSSSDEPQTRGSTQNSAQERGSEQDRAGDGVGGDDVGEEKRPTDNGKRAAQRPTEPSAETSAVGEASGRGKKKSGGAPKPSRRPVPITFDDLELAMKLDTKFSPAVLTDRVKQLDGQRVSIKGFIYAAGIFQQTGIKRFPLVKNTQCKFGPGGLAYCVILVDLKDGVTTDFTLQPITVEGILKVEPFEGPDGVTWSVYRMIGERVY